MKNITVDDILKGIYNNDNVVLQYVYEKYYPTIKSFINRNSGGDEDAKDIFQEGIVIIYQKISDNRLELSCAFKTYLYSICRLLWLKQLKKRKIKNEEYSENFVDLDNDVSEMYEKNEEYRLYQQHFEGLGDDCQKVLRLFLDKVSLKEIAQIMGYKSEKYAKKRKYQCKEALIKKIKSDSKYKELVK